MSITCVGVDIDNILASFTGVKWFTVLDLNAAFHQIAFSSEQDAELAAFVTEDGLYQMRAMPFGLTNAPAIMQHLIDRVLAPHKKYALAYMMTSLSLAQPLNST